jgi:NAD-dependent deacetylase
MTDPLQPAAQAVARGRHVIAVTGAGISVESGIPDFRSPGGIWDTYPPEDYATIEAFLAAPDRVWQLWYDLGAMLGDVQPNPGHHALTALQEMGRLDAIITQNIDNLHQESGSVRVIEYHGNGRHMRCVICAGDTPLDLTQRSALAPRCACGGVMKPDVVLFGEAIPRDAMDAANRAAALADVVIIVGTSATVYPAAELPVIAKRNGAYIIECNLEPTDFTGTITDAFLQGPAGTVLPRLVESVRGLLR